MAIRHHQLGVLLLGVWAIGCTSSFSSGGTSSNNAFLLIEPGLFLGELGCMAGSGSVQRYVTTLTDVGHAAARDGGSDAETPFVPLFITHPSSAPVPCNLDTSFGFVTSGVPYTAQIDAYDRSDITPLGPGSRIMLDENTGERVFPRWTTECGRAIEISADASPTGRELEDPTFACCAGGGQIVTVRSCEPLSPSAQAD